MPTDAERAHRIFADYVRWSAGLDDDADLLDDGDALVVAMSSDWPDTRLGLAVGEGLGPVEWAATVDEFLAARGRTASVFLRVGDEADAERQAALEARGLRAYDEVPEMLCPAPLEDRAPSDGVTVRLAASAADISTYASVAGKAFADIGLLEDSTRALLDRPDRLLADDVVVVVAEVEGVIVAGALAVVLPGDPSAYVSYVSVLTEARGRSLGDAVTRRVTNEAFARGARAVTLEASKYGEGTYRRMGYRELYRYRILIRV